jgi:hypothetical protein
MPYRNNAPTEHAAYVAAEEHELDQVAASARRRGRNARIGVAAIVAGLGAAMWALAPSKVQTPVHRCHSVEIRWENAPHLPPDRWQSCMDR